MKEYKYSPPDREKEEKIHSFSFIFIFIFIYFIFIQKNSFLPKRLILKVIYFFNKLSI